jgi:hypothetical protein
MKTNSTKHWMKVAGISLAIGTLAFTANSQTKADITKQAAATLGKISTGAADGGSIRVVDNKGTIKYLQVQNGLTQVTNTTTSGGVVTTWQLGGAFVSNTKLDLNGNLFQLDNVLVVDPADATSPTATSAQKAAAIPATTTKNQADGTTTGWTLLVRDEATGAIEKLKFTDLVTGGQTSAKIGTTNLADGTTVSSDSKAFTFKDATLPADVNKVFVFRNGAKLLASTDYSVDKTTSPYTLTVNYTNPTDPEDYTFVTGDRIEIQWVK